MASTVHIDGRTLEGGGQLVRIALAVSALTGIPIRITDVRGNRPSGGGLKNQHLAAVEFLAAVCGATISGAHLKSKTLDFKPSFNPHVELEPCEDPAIDHQKRHFDFTIEQQTDGSIPLVLQAILPFLLFTPRGEPGSTGEQPDRLHQSITVTIMGGLNGSGCPSQAYINEVLLPTLSRIGLPSTTTVSEHRHANDATERGAVQYCLVPLGRGMTLPSFQLTDRGKIKYIKAIIRGYESATTRARNELKSRLKKLADQSPSHFEDRRLEIEIQNTGSKHVYVFLVAISTNGYRLGRDRMRNCLRQNVSLADRRVDQLIEEVTTQLFGEIEHGGCVDTYMQDQLAVFQALAEGRSVVDGGQKEPSLHTKTARWVLQKMLGVEFDDRDGSCKGIGLVAGERFMDRALAMMENSLQEISIRED